MVRTRAFWIAGLPVALLVAALGVLRIDQLCARSPEVVERETGVRLPDGVEVVDASVMRFSIADGVNYKWLLRGAALAEWAGKVGRPEEGPGQWPRNVAFAEISGFGGVEEIRVSSAWRIWTTLPDGRKETAYLYLAMDGETAALHTFRP